MPLSVIFYSCSPIKNKATMKNIYIKPEVSVVTLKMETLLQPASETPLPVVSETEVDLGLSREVPFSDWEEE